MQFLMIAASLLAASQMAHAALVISASTTGGALPGTARLTFDGLPAGSAGGSAGSGVNVSFTSDGQAVSGAASGVYAAPFFNVAANDAGFGNAAGGAADGTQYLSTGVGSATLALGGNHTYLGLLWGSTDDYNKLELYDGSLLVGTIVPGLADANNTGMVPDANGAQGSSGTFYVNITSSSPFNKVVASSKSYAFEFDNVAIVPEPSTYVAGGLMMLPVLFGLRSRFLKKRA